MLKVNKTPEQNHWCHCGVFIADSVFVTPFYIISFLNFEQVNICWTLVFLFRYMGSIFLLGVKISDSAFNSPRYCVIRSSHCRCSIKKSVLKSLAKFTGKHLCQGLFFYKVKKETVTQVFSYEFSEIFKSTFFTENFRTTASVICWRYNFWRRI